MMTSDPIAAALRAMPSIDDSRVVHRRSAVGEHEALPPLVLLPTPPLTDSGDWDLAALESLAVIDAATLGHQRRWRAAARRRRADAARRPAAPRRRSPRAGGPRRRSHRRR